MSRVCPRCGHDPLQERPGTSLDGRRHRGRQTVHRPRRFGHRGGEDFFARESTPRAGAGGTAEEQVEILVGKLKETKLV